MRTKDIIEGLTVFEKHRDSDGYDISAEHDVLYANATDRPVCKADVQRLISLGWFQDDVDYGDGDFGVEHYDPGEGWACFV
jgi:hypothetical protein